MRICCRIFNRPAGRDPDEEKQPGTMLAIIFTILVESFFFTVCNLTQAGTEMAVTVDDLPIHGPAPSETSRPDIAKKILTAFRRHQIPEAYGFVIAERLERFPASIEALQAWVEAGYPLGNHTYSHSDLNKTELQDYLNDIRRNESILAKLQPEPALKMFRYPFLREGDTQEKRDGARAFLSSNGYRIAQVTIDFYDWAWNEPYVRCLTKRDLESINWLKKTYLDSAVEGLRAAERLSELLFQRGVRQILLLHIGPFTAVMLKELLATYEAQGIRFVGLREALKDDIYAINPNVVRENPHTFLNQMRIAKGLQPPPRKEPPLKELDQVCRQVNP